MYPTGYQSLSLHCGVRLRALLDVQPSPASMTCAREVWRYRRRVARRMCQSVNELLPDANTKFGAGVSHWDSDCFWALAIGTAFHINSICSFRSVPVLGLTISRIFISLTARTRCHSGERGACAPRFHQAKCMYAPFGDDVGMLLPEKEFLAVLSQSLHNRVPLSELSLLGMSNCLRCKGLNKTFTASLDLRVGCVAASLEEIRR